MRKTSPSVYSYLLLSILWRVALSNTLTLPLNPTEGLNFYGIGSFGYSVSRAGDINGDGIDDAIIGSPNEASLYGIAYVVYGSKTGLTDLTSTNFAALSANGKGFQITGLTNSRLGLTVNGAGDVNGDGIEDIIMGAPYYNSNSGMMYVIFGSKTGLRDFNLATDYNSGVGFGIRGTSASYFGYSVSGTGDVNGDGIDDMIIGAPAENSNVGAAYVIYGKKTGLTNIFLTGSDDLVSSNTGYIIKGTTLSKLGISVSGAGDVNGDGIKDVVVGAYYYNSASGYAAVLFGSKSQLSDLNVLPGTSLSGRGYIISCQAYVQLGWPVSGAGDVNGDGLADVIIVARTADFTNPTISNGGAVFVIYGSRTLSSEIDLGSTLIIRPSVGFRITSGLSYSYFGATVSNGKDFNGDGVDDIILGAAGSTAQSTNGAVYVVYGNKAGLGNIDGITPTNFVDPTKGFVISPVYNVFSVRWSGDFNGDGGPDILIGAVNNSTTYGAAYILFGTPPPSTTTVSQTLDPSEVAALNAMTQNLATAGKATSAAVASISIINFSNPAAAILKAISDTIYFIKYLNISYPPKLQYVLDTYQSEDLIVIDNISSAPQVLVDKMDKYTLPAKFEKYNDVDEFHSSFLINFWPSLIILCVILFFVLITSILKPDESSGGSGKMRRFIRWVYTKLSQIVKWNLMFSKFTGYYGSISLFTSIELRTTQFSSVLEVLSACICAVVTLGLLLAQIRMILVVQKLQKAKLQAKQKNDTKLLEITQHHLKAYEIIFERFNDNSFFQQSFLFFYYLRIYIFYSIISWLNIPLVQTSLNTSMEVIMFLYLVISRPVKSKIELFQYLVIELLFLVVNVSTLGLAVLDFYESENEKTRIGLGDAILFCNNALTYCALFFLFLSVLVMIVDVVKAIKKRGLKTNKIQKLRNVMKYHRNNSANVNDNDASIVELNPNNNSQVMNTSHNTKDSIVVRERKTSLLNSDSIIQYTSNFSLANTLDIKRSELQQDNFLIIKRQRALQLQRLNLNSLGIDHTK